MRKITKTIIGAVATAGLIAGGASAATAETSAPANPNTVVIDGREYGPEDGLVVETQQFEVEPGGEPVGVYLQEPSTGIGPLATWGASYATSTEIFELYYVGRAKAAANVYASKRIISVCFFYTRGGSNVTGTTCSNASSNGVSWSSGAEAVGAVWETLDPNAPQTIFNIRTTRIAPGVV